MTLRTKHGKNQGKKMKPRKIYLAEPHDYFGINHFLKMQERQRQLAKEGSLESLGYDYRKESCQPVNGIVPSKCWRAYDLHNKPRGLYSEEEKKIAALESSFYNKTAVSVPLKEVLATKFKRFFARFIHNQAETEPLVRESSPSSETLLKANPTSTMQYNPDTREPHPRKQVRFAPDTIFCERDDKSPFRLNLIQRKEQRVMRKIEKEEMLRPRPFLPFLESGLSYHDDEEFYRLKNSDAHKHPHIVRRESPERSHCWGIILKALRFNFCCMVEEEEGSSYSSPSSMRSFRYHEDFCKRNL